MFYTPDGGVLADVIPFCSQGEFYLFYLHDPRDPYRYGEGVAWRLLTTRDFIHFSEKGEALSRGGREEQDLYIYTGCVCQAPAHRSFVSGAPAEDKAYRLFYTGHNPHFKRAGRRQQVIRQAVSPDLLHWEKDPAFHLQAPGWLEPHDFRDPFVFYNPEREQYTMLLAARSKRGNRRRRGLTAQAVSPDLQNWTMETEPFYAPEEFYTHECPDLFRMGDWWYLLFSEFSDNVVTRYRMSRSLRGPWHTPPVDTFDGRAFYAAKTAADDQGNRFLFGWNPLRNESDTDWRWGWGGTLVVHQLKQDPDGTLWITCPETIRNAFNRWRPLTPAHQTGAVEWNGKGGILHGSNGYAYFDFPDPGEPFRLEGNFRFTGEGGRFGLISGHNPQTDEGYYLKFQPLCKRLHFEKWGRDDFIKLRNIEIERYCDLRPDQWHQVNLIQSDGLLELYVDSRVALSARMYDSGDMLALFAQGTAVEWQNVNLYLKGDTV